MPGCMAGGAQSPDILLSKARARLTSKENWLMFGPSFRTVALCALSFFLLTASMAAAPAKVTPPGAPPVPTGRQQTEPACQPETSCADAPTESKAQLLEDQELAELAALDEEPGDEVVGGAPQQSGADVHRHRSRDRSRRPDRGQVKLIRLVCAWSALLGPAVSPSEASALDVPLVRQVKDGCGAASLAMLVEYWRARGLGPPSTVAMLDGLQSPDGDGIRLSAMKGVLAENGFHAFTLRGKPAQLDEHLQKGRPLIVALRHGSKPTLHYVVVTGVDSEKVRINDPGRKKPTSLRRKKFERQWHRADSWTLIAVPKK